MMTYDLKNISLPKALFLIIIIFSCLIAPVWYIFQFQPLLFKNTDLVKLLLLSTSIGVPLIVLNAFIELYFNDFSKVPPERGLDRVYELISYGGVDCVLILYIPSMATFFFHFTLTGAIYFSLIIQLIILGFAVWDMFEINKDRSKSGPKPVQEVVTPVSKPVQ